MRKSWIYIMYEKDQLIKKKDAFDWLYYIILYNITFPAFILILEKQIEHYIIDLGFILIIILITIE